MRSVEVSGDESALVTYSARPNLKILGPRFGKQLKAIRAEIESLGSDQLALVLGGQSLASKEVEGLSYDGETLLVDRSSKEGTVTDTLDGVTVALDLEITTDLRMEGLAREVVNRVQNIRKERDLDLDARIHLDVWCEGGELAEALRAHWSTIAGEVLATNEHAPPAELAPDALPFDIEGSEIRVAIRLAQG